MMMGVIDPDIASLSKDVATYRPTPTATRPRPWSIKAKKDSRRRHDRPDRCSA
jgi:hypothetical protein